VTDLFYIYDDYNDGHFTALFELKHRVELVLDKINQEIKSNRDEDNIDKMIKIHKKWFGKRS
jgi:hypothetical protein